MAAGEGAKPTKGLCDLAGQNERKEKEKQLIKEKKNKI